MINFHLLNRKLLSQLSKHVIVSACRWICYSVWTSYFCTCMLASLFFTATLCLICVGSHFMLVATIQGVRHLHKFLTSSESGGETNVESL